MSGWYLDGKESLLARTIDPLAAIAVVGVNSDYVFDATHSEFDQIDDHIILEEKVLVNPTFFLGILDADDVRWESAGTGIIDRSLTLNGVILYFLLDNVGTLLAYVDSAVVGLPQNLEGVNVTATWPANGILKL